MADFPTGAGRTSVPSTNYLQNYDAIDWTDRRVGNAIAAEQPQKPTYEEFVSILRAAVELHSPSHTHEVARMLLARLP